MDNAKRLSKLRRKSRQCAMQALYQWQCSDTSQTDLIHQFLIDNDGKLDAEYFRALVLGVLNRLSEVDAEIASAIDRGLSELNPVECAILRVSTYEFIAEPAVPFKVVINEAIELAKVYGSEDGHKFINGVLDHLVPKLRPHG